MTLGFRAGSGPLEKVRRTRVPFTWVLLGKGRWGNGAVQRWLGADAFGQHLRWSSSGNLSLQQVVFGRVDSGTMPVMEGGGGARRRRWAEMWLQQRPRPIPRGLGGLQSYPELNEPSGFRFVPPQYPVPACLLSLGERRTRNDVHAVLCSLVQFPEKDSVRVVSSQHPRKPEGQVPGSREPSGPGTTAQPVEAVAGHLRMQGPGDASQRTQGANFT